MTLRQEVRLLSREIAKRKSKIRYLGLSAPRVTNVLRLQVSQLKSRRYGLTRTAAMRGKRWAQSYLRKLKRSSMYPYYQQIGLPQYQYNPWYSQYPQTSYYPTSHFYPFQQYGPVKAGYHPYVRGQVGAQVPSHMSRFGIGAMSADDVEGVVEPLGLDGYGDFSLRELREVYSFDKNPVGTMFAIVSGGLLLGSLFGKATKRKKQEGITAGILFGVAAYALTQRRKQLKETAGFGV